jgi:exopolysaccharide biosynthesis protein
MIRIYNGGDIKFDISSEKTNIEASVNYYIKFFTTNPDYCITKDKSSIDTTDYTIYLNWDELVKVGRGVLQYTYYYSLTNEKFDDKKFDLNNCLTTDYFIVSDTTYDGVANSGLYKYLSDKLTSEVDSRISGDTTLLQTNIDAKVDKVTGKQLSTEDYTTAEKTKLAGLSNYNDTAIKESIANKVDKVTGKSLISDTEITRLASVTNYDDSTIKTSISNKVDKVTGKSLISDSEIIRLANVSNYDDSTITKSITDETSARKTADTTLQTNIDTKVDKVTGKSLISDTEITRLASIKNYDDTTITTNITNEITRAKAAEKANADNITALQTTVNSANTEIVSITSVIGG